MADEAPSDDRVPPRTIYKAAKDGSYEVVIHMLEQDVNVHFVDKIHLLHILLDSFDRHDNTGIRDLLLQCIVKIIDVGVEVNKENAEIKTVINTAARKGLYEAVIHMLEHGFNKHYVVREHKDIRDGMLGLDVRPNNNLLDILLYNYDRHGNTGRRDLLLQCLFKIIEAGVIVDAVNADKADLIRKAAKNGWYEDVIYMLKHGFNISNVVGGHHENLLHILLDSYDRRHNTGRRDLLLQCIVRIIDGGVDLKTVNGGKEKLIPKAARKGLYELVLYMLKRFKIKRGHLNKLPRKLLDSYEYDSHDNTSRRDLLLQCLVKVVDDGVDVNQLNVEKEAVIETAARKGLYEAVIHMLEHGFNISHFNWGHHNNLLHKLLDSYDSHDNTSRRDLLLQCLVKFVDAGVDVNQLNAERETPICRAVRKGLYKAVLYMLEHGFDKHYVDERKNNLLHIVLESYNRHANTGRRDLLLQCLVKFVDAGVDVNKLNTERETPICRAVRKGLYKAVLYMLEHGFNKHYVDERQNNLLHIVLESYNRHANTCTRDLLMQVVVKLVEAGVCVNQLGEHKYTPMLIAVGETLYDVGIYLLEHGVNVHYVDIFKCNILHYVLCFMYPCLADEDKYIQLVNTLISKGINTNQPNFEGNTPLFYFLVRGPLNQPAFYMSKFYGIKFKLKTGQDIQVQLKCKLINILLEAGCNVNHRNTKGLTALMYHLQQQADISILKLLIQHSDLSLVDNYGYTALGYCVQYNMINSTNIFKLLVDSGSDLMSLNNGGKLLQDILNCKRLELFNYYIRLKLIVKGVTAEGKNMLHLLAGVNYEYSINKFKWLLNNELDINRPCSKTNTPTMIAAFLLNSKYLELLTRHPKLEINKQNNLGHTALHLCIIGFTMFKDGLNKRQVNVVVENYCKQIYPIYMACIDSLLGVDGIDVNIPDNGGRTSLMLAAMKKDRGLLRKLLKAGAIVTMLDYSGRSALQYLNIYQSVFDLTCFKLLLSNGNTGLLDIPCIDGNTIIQTALCFPLFWEPCQAICFIRYLVAENCCLQILVSSSLESNYNKFELIELSLQDRDNLRKLLYLSGAEGQGIMTALNFDEENKPYEDNEGTVHSRGTERFIRFCSNISLKSMCRRFIRQKLGLGIKEKVKDLELPYGLDDFLLLKDVLPPHDYSIDNIDDGCNDFDDYDGYYVDGDRDGDYSKYNYYQYFTLNTDHELRHNFLKPRTFPNGEVIF